MKKFKLLCRRWFIDAFSGMALGLFCTLIAGTIFEQIAKLFGDSKFADLLLSVAKMAKFLMGAGIGAGIAYSLKCNKLVIFSSMVAGLIGANGGGINPVAFGIGNPIGAYAASLLVCEVCSLFAGKTKLDILLVPLVALILSILALFTLCPAVKWIVEQLTQFIIVAMQWNSFIMGIVISVTMGILLTMPTSSAAIWVAIAAENANSPELLLAGGAAVVGCAAHMIGFAVLSYKENGISGLISQGIGTSMLQIPNIMKNPKIIIPPIVASAIVGPMATVLFKIKCNNVGGGMGTSGLVGVIQTIAVNKDMNGFVLALAIILLFFVIPAVVCLLMGKWFRKKKWIKEGDLKLSL